MEDEGTAVIEHMWFPLEMVPPDLYNLFPHGVCVVFAEEDDGGMQFTAAIPAAQNEAMRFADLFEQGAVDGDLYPYFKMRDFLCRPNHYHALTLIYKGGIDRLIEAEEAEEGRRTRGGIKAILASAAKFLPRRLSNN